MGFGMEREPRGWGGRRGQGKKRGGGCETEERVVKKDWQDPKMKDWRWLKAAVKVEREDGFEV